MYVLSVACMGICMRKNSSKTIRFSSRFQRLPSNALQAIILTERKDERSVLHTLPSRKTSDSPGHPLLESSTQEIDQAPASELQPNEKIRECHISTELSALTKHLIDELLVLLDTLYRGKLWQKSGMLL